MTCRATILIAARNASKTIKRAIVSALAQGNYPILLIDDYSQDDTVARAKAIAGDRLEVVRPSEHRTLGLARQTGLRALQTPFAVWLDADDELLPGRVGSLVAALQAYDADLASDCVQLFDGITGLNRGILPIPSFLMGMHPLARLFERNYLPGIGSMGFRSDFALRIGYDTSLHGAEDVDFVLRAILGGAMFRLLDGVGYRQHSYPNSLSRQIDNQRRMYKVALLKHDYDAVRKLYRIARLDARITAWGLLSMAIFREDYPAALGFLNEAEALTADPVEVLEPDGPLALPEGWRLFFHKGTVLLLMGRTREAIPQLEAAESILATAEGSNNLGVAKRNIGEDLEAQRLFELSLSRRPNLVDAKLNAADPTSLRVISHPCRSLPCRDDYSAQREDHEDSR